MRKRNYKYYRRIKTTQENRETQDIPVPLVRGKRKKLPSSWDVDKPVITTKSWKDKRKSQHRQYRRGKKHILTIPESMIKWSNWGNSNYVRVWELQEWFENNDIAYEFSYQYKSGFYTDYRGNKVKRRIRDGCKVVWWSDKDIGIQFYLKGKLNGCKIEVES